MSDVHRFRMAMAQYLGQPLTPEMAARIEAAVFHVPSAAHAPEKFGQRRCGRLVFQVEPFRLVLPELHQLHVQHWQETERHRHGLAMDPDYDAMAAAERAGRMLQFTARCDDTLVGNLRVYLGTSLHTNTLFATEDTLYLQPAHRGGRNALRFVQFGEDSLRAIGVREIRCTAKLVNGTARFFQGTGYTPVATEFVKFLEA